MKLELGESYRPFLYGFIFFVCIFCIMGILMTLILANPEDQITVLHNLPKAVGFVMGILVLVIGTPMLLCIVFQLLYIKIKYKSWENFDKIQKEQREKEKIENDKEELIKKWKDNNKEKLQKINKDLSEELDKYVTDNLPR